MVLFIILTASSIALHALNDLVVLCEEQAEKFSARNLKKECVSSICQYASSMRIMPVGSSP